MSDAPAGSTVRTIAFALLRWTGILPLWRTLMRHRLIILTVHGVGAPGPGQRWEPLRSRLSPARLDECLRILCRHYRFVSLDAAAEMLAGRRPMQPRSMVITFDDGYRNQLSLALPILQRHGVAATIFVSTGHVLSRRPFWFDRLDYALQQAAMDGREVGVGRQRYRFAVASRDDLRHGYLELRTLSKSIDRDDRQMSTELDDLAAALEEESGRRLQDVSADDMWSAVVTAEEIRQASEAVAFGSHTVDHVRIHRVDRATADDQLQRSKVALEAWTGKPCRFFCYPDGGYSASAAAAVTAAGYEMAVTTARGLNRAGDDMMSLRRVDMPPRGSGAELLADVSGLTDWLRAAADRLTLTFSR